MSKPVLVTGATGTIGRDIAKRLSEGGVSVRAGVRDQAKAKKELPDIALVPFDFENEKMFSAALEGVEKVFLLPPLLPNQLELMNRFVDAAKRAGVGHIVKLSAIGIDGETQSTAIKWHGASERHIRESGVAFTFLRPNSFMQNFITYFPPRNGAIYLPWGTGTASFVDTRDIANVAAKALTSDGHGGRIYTLTGPATLGIAEVALILSEVAGREFKYVDVPEAAARDGMLQAGVPPWQVELVLELHAINKQNRWSAVTSDIEKVTGTPPTDFAQFARDHADKFRAS
ncbi:MAG: NAD(P)-dependent oxidoreductase [Verrucomicrobia bacterium]|nr:MAG: NAD(P)-dependent oxidoreductase [Verrucomicrobiota bacterium]